MRALQLWILLSNSLLSPRSGLAQQIHQFDDLSLAALQNLAVRVQYRAEVDVDCVMRLTHETGLLGHLEYHLEVLYLGAPDHVEQVVAVKPLYAIYDTGEVGGGVVIATICLLDDYWHWIALPIEPSAGRVHDLRALAVLEYAARLQALDDHWQKVVVVRFAHDVVVGQEHPKHPVDLVEVAHRLVDEDPPQPQGLLVAALQQNHAVPRTRDERLIGVELGSGLLVERIQVTNAEFLGGIGLSKVEQVLDQHAERSAPVTDVVLTVDCVPFVPQHSDYRIAYHRRAEVANMHLLGHIRGRVVHCDDSSLLDGYPEPVIRQQCHHLGCEPGGVSAHVDEAADRRYPRRTR